jgi:hypothetical protein
MSVRSRAVTLVTLVVAAFGTGACSDPPAAGQVSGGRPTATATATTTTSARPTAPTTATTTTAARVTLPPEATKHTTEGARAFVRYYLEVLSVAGTRADSGPVRALSTSGCVGCQAFVTGLDKLQKSGQRFDIASITVILTVAKPGSSPNRAIVLMQGREAPSRIIASDGSTIVSYAGGALLYETASTWTNLGWRMTEVTKR